MDNKLRVLLIDDEPLAIQGLQLRLQDYREVEIIGTASNGREGIKAIKSLNPDLVFLDIQMPGIDGLGVVRSLLGTDMPLFVFVTAYDKYAIEAFEANALDYIVKPVDEERLKDSLFRAREALKSKNAVTRETQLVEMLSNFKEDERNHIKELLDDPEWQSKERYPEKMSFKDGTKVIVLNADDVDWIDAAGDYMCVHAGGKTHIIRETMKALEARLDPARFQRVHRSAIVNVNKVKELHPHSNSEYFLILEGGQELKLSRSYKDVISRFL